MQLAWEIRLPPEPEGTFSRGFPLSDGKWLSTLHGHRFFLFILQYCNIQASIVKSRKSNLSFQLSYVFIWFIYKSSSERCDQPLRIDQKIQRVLNAPGADICLSEQPSAHAFLLHHRNGKGACPAHQLIVTPISDGGALICSQPLHNLQLFCSSVRANTWSAK